MTSEEVGSVVTDPANTAGLVWGDYDNDGDQDLYVARSSFQSVDGTCFNFFHENQGDGTFRRVGIGSPTTGRKETWAACWVDYDRDGLGAMVRLKARIGGAERWQMRQIASSTTGQPLVAHFGLGDATRVDVLRVTWLSGVVQEFTDLVLNQSLVIKEPPRLVPTGPCEFEVKCWPGMRFTVEASHDLETWMPVGSVTHVNGAAKVSDAVGAHGTCRFYRVVND